MTYYKCRRTDFIHPNRTKSKVTWRLPHLIGWQRSSTTLRPASVTKSFATFGRYVTCSLWLLFTLVFMYATSTDLLIIISFMQNFHFFPFRYFAYMSLYCTHAAFHEGTLHPFNLLRVRHSTCFNLFLSLLFQKPCNGMLILLPTSCFVLTWRQLCNNIYVAILLAAFHHFHIFPSNMPKSCFFNLVLFAYFVLPVTGTTSRQECADAFLLLSHYR